MLSCVVSGEGLGTFKGRANSGKVEDKGVERIQWKTENISKGLGL